MLQNVPASILMLINAVLRRIVPSAPSSGSWACDRCGFAIEGHVEAGTSSSTYVIDCFRAKQSRYRHVVVVTSAGKLSTLCESSQFAEHRSQIDSGVNDGTCSIEKS